MIKIRMALDKLLDNKKFHFGLYGKKLAIVGDCGNPIMIFRDIEIGKNPTNKELNFVRDILIDKIDEINEKLNKYSKLIENKPEKPECNITWLSYVITIDNIEFEIDKATNKIKKVISHKIVDLTKYKNEIERKIEEIKKYEDYMKEIEKFKESMNECNI